MWALNELPLLLRKLFPACSVYVYVRARGRLEDRIGSLLAKTLLTEKKNGIIFPLWRL